jgi:hypothetical protein
LPGATYTFDAASPLTADWAPFGLQLCSQPSVTAMSAVISSGLKNADFMFLILS